MNNFLGLGVNVSMTNSVSPVASQIINSFLNVQQGAQSMVDKVTKSFIGLTALQESGDTLTRFGETIKRAGDFGVDKFKELGKAVIETSSEFERYRVSLESLYHSQAKGDQMFNWAQQMSVRYPMQIMDIMRTIVSMQGAGIDITKDFGKNGKQYNVLTAMSDISHGMGLPNTTYAMRGIEEAVDSNMWNEWNRGMLKTPKGTIEEAMGQKFSSAQDSAGKQQRLDELMAYIQKRFGGLTTNLQDSWFTLQTDFQDMWTNFKGAIGSSGFFQDFEQTMFGFYQFVTDHSQQVIQFAHMIGEGFKAIWDAMKPLAIEAEKLFIQLMDYSKVHPAFGKLVAIGLALASAFLVISGSVLIFAGNAISAAASLGVLALAMQSAKEEGFSLSGSMLGVGAMLLKTIMFATLFAGASALAYLAWRTNFLGIKTTIEDFVQNVTKGLTDVYQLLTSTDPEQFTKKWKSIGKNFEWVKDLATDIALVIAFMSDLFGSKPPDSIVNFFGAQGKLSDLDNMKALANNTRQFALGLTDAIKQMWAIVGPILSGMLSVLKSLASWFGIYASAMTGAASKNDPSSWRALGNAIGWLGLTLGAMSIASKITAIAKALGLIKSAEAGAALANVFLGLSNIGKVVGVAVSGLGKLAILLAGMLFDGATVVASVLWVIVSATWAWTVALLANPVTWIVLGIVAAVAGLIIIIVLLVKHWSDVEAVAKRVLNWIEDKVKKIIDWFKNLGTWISNIFGGKNNLNVTVHSGAPSASNPVTPTQARFPGADTGGFIPREGLVNLHPGEVVLNAPQVDKLSGYINQLPENNFLLDALRHPYKPDTNASGASMSSSSSSGTFVASTTNTSQVIHHDSGMTIQQLHIHIEGQVNQQDPASIRRMAQQILNELKKLQVEHNMMTYRDPQEWR